MHVSGSRRFVLTGERDADGVCFTDGTTVIYWVGERGSFAIYGSLADALNDNPKYAFLWLDAYDEKDVERGFAPYTFGKETRLVPVVVYRNGQIVSRDNAAVWTTTIFVSREEEMYALSSASLKNRNVRVVTASDWRSSKVISRG